MGFFSPDSFHQPWNISRETNMGLYPLFCQEHGSFLLVHPLSAVVPLLCGKLNHFSRDNLPGNNLNLADMASFLSSKYIFEPEHIKHSPSEEEVSEGSRMLFIISLLS